MALQNIKTKPAKVNNIETVYNTRKVNLGTNENPNYKYNVQLPATDASQVYYDYNSDSVTINTVNYGNQFGDNRGSILSLKTIIDKIILQIGKEGSTINLGDFNNSNINARLKWLYDNRLSINDIGTFWKYIGQVSSLSELGNKDTNHTTQIKKYFRVSTGNTSPLTGVNLAKLTQSSIDDSEVITLSDGTTVKWKEIKVGSVIHVEKDGETSIHDEYVLISITGPRQVTVNNLGGNNTYDYYIDFQWTQFGPDLSGYAKTSTVNDLSSKVSTNTSSIETINTVINDIKDGRTTVGKAKELAEPRTVELTLNNGTSNKSSVSIDLPLGEPAEGDDYDASVSTSAILTLPNSGVTAGPYSCVSVNSKGIVTKGQQFIVSASNLTAVTDLAVGGIAIVESLS